MVLYKSSLIPKATIKDYVKGSSFSWNSFTGASDSSHFIYNVDENLIYITF